MNDVTALTQVVQECSIATLDGLDQFPKAFSLARGIRQLRELITPELLADIRPLMNSPLGFMTDKNPATIDYKTGQPHKPYSDEIVRECFIEATLRGLSPVGNEWNILGGRCYVTKAGLARKLRELSGLTDFKPTFDVPKMVGEKGAVVRASATWKYNGIPDGLERDFAVKVNSGMGSDAIIGKAERKLRAAVYEQITGSALSDGEANEQDSIETTATKTAEPKQTLEEKLAAKGATIPPATKTVEPGVIPPATPPSAQEAPPQDPAIPTAPPAENPLLFFACMGCRAVFTVREKPAACKICNKTELKNFPTLAAAKAMGQTLENRNAGPKPAEELNALLKSKDINMVLASQIRDGMGFADFKALRESEPGKVLAFIWAYKAQASAKPATTEDRGF